MIEIEKICKAEKVSGSVNIVGFDWAKFRTYNRLLNVKYVYIGSPRRVLELNLDLDTSIVRGFDLVRYDLLHTPKQLQRVEESYGLPILKKDIPHVLPGKYRSLSRFTVGFGKDFVEIKLGATSRVKQIIAFDRVRFLTDRKSLIGIRIVDVSPEEIKALKTLQVKS